MTLSRHLSYANVASTLAVVLALGGGGAAVAAGVAKNSVGSKQIKAGAVKNIDLGPNAVDGSKVADDALTGADISESTLAKVPSAATADQATNLLWAVVEANGTLVKASGAGIVSTRFATGVYDVRFGRDVSQCAAQASSGKIGNGVPDFRILRTAGLDGVPTGIYVETANTSGTLADGGFVLTVVC